MNQSPRNTRRLSFSVLSTLKNRKKRVTAKRSKDDALSSERSSKSQSLQKALAKVRASSSTRSKHLSRRQAALSDTDCSSVDISVDGPNVIQFLQDDCPEDVLRNILAYAGPQKTAALSKVNRTFRDIIAEETTWKVLCEELYKWKPGQAEPVSWKEHYALNPCVPIDVSTVSKALELAGFTGSSKSMTQRQSHNLNILIRPGRYVVRDTITIDAMHRTNQVTMQAMDVPGMYRHVVLVSKPTLKRRNQPLVQVLYGGLVMRDICLEHSSLGVDLWNGNAAIQLKPDRASYYTPIPQVSVCLERVQVYSNTGRGVVVMDGAHLAMQDSYVHDCAATGVYVGGPGSVVTLQDSDLEKNGMGSQGIARGHSGMCIEQGRVKIVRCNVSKNSASGISVISENNTSLTLLETDVIGNGSGPLEVSGIPNVDHRSNRLSFMGTPTPRSSVLQSWYAEDDDDSMAL